MAKHHVWKLIVAVALAATLVVPGVSATSMVFQSPPPVPPPNDNFANATQVSGDSYNSGWTDVSLATTEMGEQTTSCGYTIQHTIWYAFTAPSNGQINVSVYGDYYYYSNESTIGMNVFQGPVGGLPTLEAYCTTWSPSWGGGSLSFTAQGGTTYYFQVATTYAISDNQLVFNFQFVPPPPPPANDNFADATVISYINQSLDVTGATTETGEPTGGCNSPYQHTVWYKFTAPTSGAVMTSLWGSYDAVLNVYRADGPGMGGLSSSLICGSGSWWLPVAANSTYYFQVGTISSGGSLQFNMSFEPAPANDNFADAKIITALPYDDNTYMATAALEIGEPTPSCGSTSKTIWYAYTPAASGSVSQRTDTWSSTVVGVYTGNSLSTLQEVACRSRNYDSSFLTFHVNAGTTYYFQVGTNEYTSVPFHLQIAEPPYPNFGFYPYDPNAFDNVYFDNYSWDPANAGIQSILWDFGDGTTATEPWSPSHRYTNDGDYTVNLTVTTPDERTASTSRTASVKTHDVTIAKFSVPQSAKVGQTRQIAVGISNKRYPEEVEVQLYKSYPGYGWQWVGSLRQSVPVRSGNRTTEFSFNYTFTTEDGVLGKVTFRAVATLIDTRDALPADNEAIALPTKVNK
jgi:PKD repeat protein